MNRLFGTDGVRGIVGKELTKELAYKLGVAGARVLTKNKDCVPKILIGCDTRESCDMLMSALVAGIKKEGANPVILGVIPTPGVAVLTRLYNADAAVMISASHNPYEFNGIKFFDGKGYKLPDDVEDEIESVVISLGGGVEINEPKEERYDRASRDYINYLKGTTRVDFSGLSVVLDCANGASSEFAPIVFRELGAKVTVINDKPDGTNINKDCGSTHIEALKREVLARKADIGFAFDGDADRVLAVDEKGQMIDGDMILAVIGNHMKDNNILNNNTIVVTIMSNMGFDVMAKREGIDVVKTKVGDRYVLEEMLKNGYEIGGEQSGHVILLKYNTTGDGMLTAIKFLEVLSKENKKASELSSVMEVYPQVLKNARVNNENKNKYLTDEVIKNVCEEVKGELRENGRLIIRPSGTEPLIRVMIEGKDKQYIEQKASMLAGIIEERLYCF